MTSSDDGRWASTVDDAGAMTMADAPAPSSLPRPSTSSSESESRAALERALTQDDDPLLDLETAPPVDRPPRDGADVEVGARNRSMRRRGSGTSACSLAADGTREYRRRLAEVKRRALVG